MYEKVCYPRNENVVGQTKADSKSFKRVYSEDRKTIMGFGNENSALQSKEFKKPKCASNCFWCFFLHRKTGNATGQTNAAPIFQMKNADKKINRKLVLATRWQCWRHNFQFAEMRKQLILFFLFHRKRKCNGLFQCTSVSLTGFSE